MFEIARIKLWQPIFKVENFNMKKLLVGVKDDLIEQEGRNVIQ